MKPLPFKTIILLLLLVTGLTATGNWQQKIFYVKYISAENVYIDAGTSDSLMVGDELLIIRDGNIVANIEIIHISENSASCKIIQKQVEIMTGDKVRLLQAAPRIQAEMPDSTNEQITQKAAKFKRSRQKKQMKVSGGVSLQTFYFNDDNITGYDFFQPAARVNFRIKRILDQNINFRFKIRSKYNNRSGNENRYFTADNWRHRLYEMYFYNENPNTKMQYRVGRILTNNLSGIGYIDGFQYQHPLGNQFFAGAFAGTQPDHETSGFSSDVKKMGVFAGYHTGKNSSNYFESNLAVATENSLGNINRDFVYVSNIFRRGKYFSLYQSMQIDLFRGWRQEKAGKSAQISQFLMNSRIYLTSGINLQISYNLFQNYYSYLNKNISAVAFDNNRRHGFRTALNFSLPGKFRLYSYVGYRFVENRDNPNYSFGFNLNNYNIFQSGYSAYLRFSAFANDYTKSYNPSVLTGKNITRFYRVNAGYGTYIYNFKYLNKMSINHWLRIENELTVFKNMYAIIHYEYSWAGAIRGQQVYFDISYRL